VEWAAALGRALAAEPSPGSTSLFLEERQDASVSVETGAAAPRVVRTRLRGLAVDRLGGESRFWAEPTPEGVERLASAAPKSGGGTLPPAEEPADWLSVAEGRHMVEAIAVALEGLQPGARVEARWVAFEQRVHVASHGREVVADRRRGSRLRLLAHLERRGRSAFTVVEEVLRPAAAALAGRALDALAERAAERLETRLGAEPAPSGEWAVVFAPGAGGVLVHELVGHALEADTMLSGASWLSGAGSEGFRCSAEIVVLDDPRRGRAAWRVDDEGEAARPTALIRGGRVAGWLHDRASARECARTPTGHGRRAGFRDPIRPRMGCTFLAAGRWESGDALQGIENGIYVRRLEFGSTDPRTGRSTFRVVDADRVRHGRLTFPLAAHLLWVDGPIALAEIERVAGDIEFDTCVGSCLHHGQPLAVSVGAPTFRVRRASARF
jgi:TldD protein